MALLYFCDELCFESLVVKKKWECALNVEPSFDEFVAGTFAYSVDYMEDY